MIEKPQTFNGDLANLPAALAPLCQQPRWVVWSWEWRKTKAGGKWTKPPRQARSPSRLARSNDPATWGSYTDAVAVVAAGQADGIGYMLSTSDIAAGDLDHCRNPETGMVDPWAETLHAEANGAYQEITVSGRGLRIIGIASGPEIHRRFTFDRETGAGLELYRNTARYITISGREIGHCAELPPLDGFIDTLLTRYTGKAQRQERDGNGVGAKYDFNDAGPHVVDRLRRGDQERRAERPTHRAVPGLRLAPGGEAESVEEIVAELEQYPHGIGEKYAGRLHEEVERSYEKWQAERQPNPASDTEEEEPEEPVLGQGRQETATRTDLHECATRAEGARYHMPYDVFHDRFLVEGKIVKGAGTNLDHTVLTCATKIHKAYGFDPGTQNTHDALVALCLQTNSIQCSIISTRCNGMARRGSTAG